MAEQARAVATAEERLPTASAAVDGIASAINALIARPDLDVSKVRELFELQRQVRRDEAEAAFNDAMNEAQTAMDPVRKDANNPSTKSRYASYAALDAAIRPIYAKHGFSVSFNTGDGAPDNHVRVIAEVARSGFSKFYHLDIPADGKGAKGGDVMTKTHATMSAVTYGKRGLQGMIWNIATTDKDDDGNAAGIEVISEEQVEVLRKKIEDYDAETTKILEFAKVARLEEITNAQYQRVHDALDNWARKAGKK